MQYTYFSKNGQILDIELATIPLQNIEYSYGYGVYETVKIRNGILYFLNQHLQRLLRSANIIGIEHKYSQTQIKKYITDLLQKEKIDSCNIKIILIGGKTKLDSQLFMLPLAPLFPNRKYYTEGVKTETCEYVRQFPQAKTLNMLGSYLAYKKARNNDCYDSLLLDKNKNIIEGTRTNFFTIKNKVIFTQEEEAILPGVTRETLLYVAKELGYIIEIKEVKVNELTNFDGAFLTSTSSKIVPIKQIDDFNFDNIANSIKLLIKAYDEFLKNSKGKFTTRV